MNIDLRDKESAAALGREVAEALGPRREFLPPRNGPCLCGSGLNYKRCCADRLPGREIGTKTRCLLKEEKYKEALYACRADITQYTIWHKNHTEPALRLAIPKMVSLLEIDIRALADLVDTLLWCHIKADLIDEFPAVLERLRYNIRDARWPRKIVFFHAIHALWPDWDENAGRRELRKLGSVAEDNDIETLQLYLDLFGDDLTFSERQDLINRILSLSETLADRIHYKGSKAALYLSIGDHRGADRELSEIIDEARAKYGEGKLTEYERYRLALVLDLRGALCQDDKLLSLALSLYQELLKEDHWSSHGRADLFRRIGETYRHKREWAEARNSYAEALKLDPLEIYKVFLSECLLQLDQLEEATNVLFEVKPEDLSSAEYLDYGFTLAAVAIETGERGRLEAAKAALNRANARDPYFRERRDALLLNLQEALISGASPSLIRRTRRLLADLTRSAASCLILKPSFMGIGIDIGKIFEDLSKRGAARVRLQDPSQGHPDEPPKRRGRGSSNSERR
jgi:tetratricopeptide (TPR) repeat protein